MPGHDIRVEVIRLTDIYVVGERRPLDEAAVRQLAASIESIGLEHPITVRYVTDIVLPDEEEPLAGFRLIAGAHRLAAHKRLGLESIDCVVVRWSERTARKWEIAENLHRADLSELQRKLEIAEWIRLAEKDQAEEVSAQVAPKPQGGRPTSGINAASKELGIERTEAQRAVKIGSISERAREAAIAAKLDNNQKALLVIAAAPEEQQVDKVHAIAEERARRAEARRAARAGAPKKPKLSAAAPGLAARLDQSDKRADDIAQIITNNLHPASASMIADFVEQTTVAKIAAAIRRHLTEDAA